MWKKTDHISLSFQDLHYLIQGPDVSVNKTGLSLITLSKPVCFDCDNDPVDIVLTLAATDDTSHLQKLQSMAEFISDEENIEFIKNAKSAEEVAKAINEFEPEE